MKKLFFVLLTLILFGCCSEPPYTYEVKQDDKRFQVVYSQHRGHEHMDVIIDKETGVKYLLVKNGYGAGLTKLEEQEIR